MKRILGLLPIFLVLGCGDSTVQPATMAKNPPTVTLSSVTYPAGLTALKTSNSASFNVVLSGAAMTSLVSVTGTSAAPPAGLTIVTSGSASCTTVAMSAASTNGAIVTFAGCTGSGTATVTANAGIATASDNSQNVASASTSVVIDNTIPIATATVANGVSGTTTGDNVLTVQFSKLVQPISSINATSVFTVTGCTTTQPTVSVSMSTDGAGHSIATGTIGSGSCANNDLVHVAFHPQLVTDYAGNVGAVLPITKTYVIDTVLPVATLATPIYSAGGTVSAVNAATHASLALSFTNTSDTSLVGATGTSTAPPTGLGVAATGTAACSIITLGTPVASGSNLSAAVTVGGCTGDGTVTVQASAGTVISAGGIVNAASSIKTVNVETTLPIATPTLGTPASSGNNTLSVAFNEAVQTPANNLALTITGGTCGSPPTISTPTASVDGLGNTTLLYTLSGGGCSTGDSVNLSLDLTQLLNLAGDIGATSTYTTSYNSL